MSKSIGVRIRHRADCDCPQQHRAGCLAPLAEQACRCPRPHLGRCAHREQDGGRFRCGCPWAYTAESWTGGARRQVTGSGFTSKRAAEDARREALGRLERREVVADRRQTVAIAIERWLSDRIDAGELRPTTARSYSQHVRSYVIPLLGSHRLADLTRADVGEFERHLSRTHKSLSAATRQRVGATLRVFLRDAVDRGWLAIDPTTTRRGDRSRKHATPPPVRVWQPAQLGLILDWLDAKGDRLAPIVGFAVATGLRRGEVCGLRWVDVDMRAGQITVAQQVVLSGSTIYVGAPKTRAGEHRRVSLDGGTIALLREVAARQAAVRAEAGESWQELGLVFTQSDGLGISPEALTKRFPKLIRAYNVAMAHAFAESPADRSMTATRSLTAARSLIDGRSLTAEDWGPAAVLRWHDLRHTHASLMLASGADIGSVSARLGHSSIAITQSTYRHMINAADRADAEAAVSMIPRGVAR